MEQSVVEKDLFIGAGIAHSGEKSFVNHLIGPPDGRT